MTGFLSSVTGNGALMGSELEEAARKDFHVDVRGEGPLKMVELLKDGEVVHRWTPSGTDIAGDHAISDDGPGWYLVRATQLDNHIAWSSPIWFG